MTGPMFLDQTGKSHRDPVAGPVFLDDRCVPAVKVTKRVSVPSVCLVKYGPKIRNGKAAERETFRAGYPAYVRGISARTSGAKSSPPLSTEKYSFLHGRP